MKRQLMCAAFFLSGSVAAVEPFVMSDGLVSRDTDGNRVTAARLGLGLHLEPDNSYDLIAYRHGEYRFESPGVKLKGRSDALLLAKTWDTDALGELRTEAELGSLKVEGLKSFAVGHLQASGFAGPNAIYELRLERNFIDSTQALRAGIRATSVMLGLDYDFAPGFNLSSGLAYTRYSDGNRRPELRSKIVGVVAEDWGVSAYARTRMFGNSDPYPGTYFSPRRFIEVLPGLQLRRRIGAWGGSLVAFAEYGREKSDGTYSPVHGWQVRFESFPSQMWRFEVAIGEKTTSSVGSGPGYRYRYGRVNVVIPF